MTTGIKIAFNSLSGISNNVGFVENMKYGYTFNGKTTIIAPSGTQDGISEISITGSATIIGMQKCGALLYLKGVEITQGSKVHIFFLGFFFKFLFNNSYIYRLHST